ncbi:hypothetical protein HLH33_11125 [Gluconacetobacter diazotrophicus]|uniref:Uncharacterized protein n=1 Tax=Gluconacetobacter diazotrophicus TaxID=33996 RepID=A0A7W4NFQ2_GLUDI|nr:hypothetical protein [Gluconacetobacter diazotrophicus]
MSRQDHRIFKLKDGIMTERKTGTKAASTTARGGAEMHVHHHHHYHGGAKPAAVADVAARGVRRRPAPARKATRRV